MQQMFILNTYIAIYLTNHLVFDLQNNYDFRVASLDFVRDMLKMFLPVNTRFVSNHILQYVCIFFRNLKLRIK